MKNIGWAMLGAAALFALPAAAKDASDIDYHEMTKPVQKDLVNVQANAGVGGFLGGLGNVTGVGPTWGVRASSDVSRGFGVEVGYDGSRIPLTDNRLQTGAAAWQTGLDAMAKAYVPLQSHFRPFAGIGVGESYVNVNNKAEGLYRNDWITSLPLAAGVQYNLGNFTAGARATWSLMAGEEFAQPASPANSEGSMLQANVNLGGRF